MKLIFKGVVQGVGFRPTIYRVAQELKLKGYVLNNGSEVEVVIDKNEDVFLKKLRTHLPSTALITEVLRQPDDRTFRDFRILHSKDGERHSRIPVDVCTCDDCLKELFDAKNKRYQYPFTNCTVCGARFSLVTDVPYDRERTSMKDFPLCNSCKKEYKNPLDRRYHAQTISCPMCGPTYRLYDSKKNDLGCEHAIKRFAEHLNDGCIGVMKSLGGMHLCCTLDQLSRFRKWYHRPQKAFAIMVRNRETAGKYADITKKERELLLSKQRPIVLVQKKTAELASPGLNTIGLYLPYTGTHHILFSYLKADALVMTSANIPGEPMIIRNEDAFSLGAEMYLLHNRDIPNRVDDSVVRICNDHTFFLRKSRGFIPDPLPVSYQSRVLSVGAEENICGAVSSENQVYMTQYIGNGRYYHSLKFLEQSLRHLMKLTIRDHHIDAVAMDLHPKYETKRIAEQFAKEFRVPCTAVQHHWAHAASLLVDNAVDESVVLTLDGLGYGSDGTFWGGEALSADFHGFERVGHLENIPLLGGDQATKDPRRLVFAIFNSFKKEKYFSGDEANVLEKLMSTSPQSSSFGRILDALSCYLDICTKRTYDGEPAMKLERYLAKGKPTYSFEVKAKQGIVQTTDVFQQLDEITKPKHSEQQKADVAFSFVKAIIDSLTDIAVDCAQKKGIETIGLTGGVSYNIPITEMVEAQAKKAGLSLLVHHRVPNGDGGIAVGQNTIVGHQI